jgi:hypothetical protein
MDKAVIVLCKLIGYVATIVVALAVLLRGIVPFLWGTGSALGLLGAVVIGVLGIILIIWLASKFYKNIKQDLN